MPSRRQPEGLPLTRRGLLQSVVSAWTSEVARAQGFQKTHADYTIETAPYSLEVSPGNLIQTVAYNAQVPGPLLRLKTGKSVVIDVKNRSKNREVVHWHGLFIPPDGAMEEGTPLIDKGADARYVFPPNPAGFRWFHTHTFAGCDL